MYYLNSFSNINIYTIYIHMYMIIHAISKQANILTKVLFLFNLENLKVNRKERES